MRDESKYLGDIKTKEEPYVTNVIILFHWISFINSSSRENKTTEIPKGIKFVQTRREGEGGVGQIFDDILYF